MTRFRPHHRYTLSITRAAAVLAATGLVGVGLWAARQGMTRKAQHDGAPQKDVHPARLAARRARQGSAILAASSLIDSATEHYRGNFHRWEMYLGPAAAAAALIGSTTHDRAPVMARNAVLGLAATTGLMGHIFHAQNIMNRPGRLGWTNLFYAAPLGAPGAVVLAGLAGLAATSLEQHEGLHEPILHGHSIAMGTVVGLIGTTAEVALFHFRGAFHNPFMYIPVTLPPIAALALAATAVNPTPRHLRLTRRLLGATVAMGVVGTGFHAWGVHRNMGGWRNWMQNLQVAPPLPAPPGFTGVAIVGLGALNLLEASS